MSARIERFTIIGLALFIAVSGAAGAIGLIGGGLPFPPEWLEGTPFSSYVGPGLILGVIVGGSALVAAALTVLGHPLAIRATVAAGAIQLGWILGEVLLVGTHGALMLWLQIVYGAAGAVLALVALDLLRRSPVSASAPRPSASAGRRVHA
jgi:hypothetical protein